MLQMHNACYAQFEYLFVKLIVCSIHAISISSMQLLIIPLSTADICRKNPKVKPIRGFSTQFACLIQILRESTDIEVDELDKKPDI